MIVVVRSEPGETPLPKIQISVAGSRVEGTHITQPILSLARYMCSKRDYSIPSEYEQGIDMTRATERQHMFDTKNT